MHTFQCANCGNTFHAEETHREFCSRRCAAETHGRKRSENKLQRVVGTDPDFYVKVLVPSHPKAVSGYVNEHVLVAEHAFGRFLPPKAEVHHVDRNRQNNSPGNLVICENKKYHRLLHAREDRLNDTGSLAIRRCCHCHEPKELKDFNSNSQNWDGRSAICKTCRVIKRKEYRAAAISTS